MNTLFVFLASIMAFFSGLITPGVDTNSSINEAVNTKGYTSNFIYRTDPTNGSSVPDHMIFISPSGENIQIPEKISDKLDKGKESLSNYMMPVNPLNKDEIFLATTEYQGDAHRGEGKVLLHIYSYNLKTSELFELHSSLRNESTELTYNSATSSTKQQAYLVPKMAGIQGTKIIFADKIAGDSPGPCTDFWKYFGRNDFLYFDITHPGQGLKKFIVPQATLDASAQEAKSCEVEEFGTVDGVPFPKVKDADIQSFVLTKDGIAKDSRHVYTWHKDHFDVLEGADPKTITKVGECLRVWGKEEGEVTPYGKMTDVSYFRDATHIYPDLEPSKIDADSFVYYGDYQSGPVTFNGDTIDKVAFAKDKNGVYVGCGTKIEGVDTATFSVLDYGYSRDRQHVYFLNKVVEGADPKTFKPTEPEPY